MHNFFSRHTAVKEALLTPLNWVYRVNPRLGLSLIYFLKSRRWPDLDTPRTFHEKMQWLKLNYRPALYPICADKYAMRTYLEQKGCAHLMNELYWVGEDAADIPFAQLPMRFVLKTTHGCGYNILCRDKASMDTQKAVKTLNRWRNKKYLEAYGEWFYGEITPRIICEKLLDGDADSGVPKDYKVMCFGGVPRLIQLDVGRFTQGHFRNVYDTHWNLLEYRILIPNNLGHMEGRPDLLDDMLHYARVLSEPFPFARIDFYISGGRLIVGEITLTPGAGFDFHYSPAQFAEQMGRWLTLPEPCRPGETPNYVHMRGDARP